MIQKYIIDKTDVPNLLTGKELSLAQGSRARAFCIEIAGGMTKGEVVQILFPNADYEAGKQFMHITNINSIGEISVPLDWWNAPYKAESEDKK